jgi:hypothetical protein
LLYISIYVKVFFMTIEAGSLGPNADPLLLYPSISYEEALLVSPEEGLQQSGMVRPFAVEPPGERVLYMAGLNVYGGVVEQPVANLPGIVDVIGDSIVFSYLHKAKESQQRVGRLLGIWRGVHDGHIGQDTAWYLIVEDMARRSPSTGIITSAGLPTIKYFSLDCFRGGPNGNAADPVFRRIHNLPYIEQV